MRKKRNHDVLAIINDFKKIIDSKPSATKMMEEVRMMKFKVRPIQGDISEFNLKNDRLLEMLWSLGKLDEFFQKELTDLPTKEKKVFVRIFDGLYQQFQSELNGINLKKNKFGNPPPVLEMEIFREKHTIKKIN